MTVTQALSRLKNFPTDDCHWSRTAVWRNQFISPSWSAYLGTWAISIFRRKTQEELASLSTESTHIVVENGTHHLQFFQPEVVIDAVEKMVDLVRSKH